MSAGDDLQVQISAAMGPIIGQMQQLEQAIGRIDAKTKQATASAKQHQQEIAKGINSRGQVLSKVGGLGGQLGSIAGVGSSAMSLGGGAAAGFAAAAAGAVAVGVAWRRMTEIMERNIEVQRKGIEAAQEVQEAGRTALAKQRRDREAALGGVANDSEVIAAGGTELRALIRGMADAAGKSDGETAGFSLDLIRDIGMQKFLQASDKLAELAASGIPLEISGKILRDLPSLASSDFGLQDLGRKAWRENSGMPFATRQQADAGLLAAQQRLTFRPGGPNDPAALAMQNQRNKNRELRLVDLDPIIKGTGPVTEQDITEANKRNADKEKAAIARAASRSINRFLPAASGGRWSSFNKPTDEERQRAYRLALANPDQSILDEERRNMNLSTPEQMRDLREQGERQKAGGNVRSEFRKAGQFDAGDNAFSATATATTVQTQAQAAATTEMARVLGKQVEILEKIAANESTFMQIVRDFTTNEGSANTRANRGKRETAEIPGTTPTPGQPANK